MPYRASFDCLWCGSPHTCRGPDDLEGWAQVCPTCIGRAGDNGFLRFRLRDALTERGAIGRAAPPEVAPPSRVDRDAEMLAYYEARAPEYDDWYLRRGRYARGPIHDTAWAAELDVAGRWLDGLPIQGEIVELAAGTGWWSPLLASKGELSLYDAVAAPLERARERLVAHQLRAHLHLRDAWAEPDRAVDAVFTGFWLSHVPRARLDGFLAIVRRWLKPDGIFAFIDSRLDPRSSAADHAPPTDDLSVRLLDDGRAFTVVKVFHEPAELEAALARAGFDGARVVSTGRFFLTGVARAR
jgi:demethylmenaquinone methyltransferase/2-methoxy-6-polyprenyl-1,4-benzoquinol methylase